MRILKTLRDALGLKQKEVAEQVGVQVTTYTKWETEPRYPKVEDLKKLAELYKFPIEFMIYNPEAELSHSQIEALARSKEQHLGENQTIKLIETKALYLNENGMKQVELFVDMLLTQEQFRKMPEEEAAM